jgi:hypothetical protein
MMKKYLISKGVSALFAHATSKPDWTSSSFKVAIAAKDAEKSHAP